jgi:hypothetical protein
VGTTTTPFVVGLTEGAVAVAEQKPSQVTRGFRSEMYSVIRLV